MSTHTGRTFKWIAAVTAGALLVAAMPLIAQVQPTSGSRFGPNTTGTNGSSTNGSSFGSNSNLGSALSGLGGSSTDGTSTGTGGLNLSNIQNLLNQAGLGTNTTGNGTTGLTPTNGTNGNGLTNLIGQSGTAGQNINRTPTMTDNTGNTTGPALSLRAPGNQIKYSIGVHNGTLQPISSTTDPRVKTFWRTAIEEIYLTILEGLTNGIGSLGSGLGGLSGLSGLGSNLFNPGGAANNQNNVTPIENATTTGQGTVTPVQ